MLKTKWLLLFPLLLLPVLLFSQISICSWNLKNFGKSKSDEEIDFIVQVVKEYDVVLIQEVVAKDPGGAQAVGRLGEALMRKGIKWEYRVSDPTSGDNSYKRERYAILWKPSRVALVGRPWLEHYYHNEIDREPFMATFQANGKQFTVVNFHAITKSMQPETEVKYFKLLPAEYPNLHLLFCGDWNLPQDHSVFNPLKQMGYKPALLNQKTTLRQKGPTVNCLVSPFDNVLYHPGNLTYLGSGVIEFYKAFSDVSEANAISDHIPMFFRFAL